MFVLGYIIYFPDPGIQMALFTPPDIHKKVKNAPRKDAQKEGSNSSSHLRNVHTRVEVSLKLDRKNKNVAN